MTQVTCITATGSISPYGKQPLPFALSAAVENGRPSAQVCQGVRFPHFPCELHLTKINTHRRQSSARSGKYGASRSLLRVPPFNLTIRRLFRSCSRGRYFPLRVFHFSIIVDNTLLRKSSAVVGLFCVGHS